METKRLLQLDGRDATHPMAYSIHDDTCQKPPFHQAPTPRQKPPPPPLPLSAKRFVPIVPPPAVIVDAMTNAGHPAGSGAPRVRSASTGRDKRSELQARYWALLFGNLQRAISEIYATVECYENLSSCQETILVLENYCRDFRALADWFQVSWDYETRPQRGAALAWDVPKSNPTSPRLYARSLSSPNPPALAGQCSPCPPAPSINYHHSGKSSPCPTIDECELQQRSPAAVDETEVAVVQHSDVPECDSFAAVLPPHRIDQSMGDNGAYASGYGAHVDTDSSAACHAEPVETADQYCQTDLEDENLTLIQWRQKYEPDKYPVADNDGVAAVVSVDAQSSPQIDEQPPSNTLSAAANATSVQLNDMESQFLRSEMQAKAARHTDCVPLVAVTKIVQARVDTSLKKIHAPAVVPQPSHYASATTTPAAAKYSSVLNHRPTNTANVNSARSRAPLTATASAATRPRVALAPKRTDAPAGTSSTNTRPTARFSLTKPSTIVLPRTSTANSHGHPCTSTIVQSPSSPPMPPPAAKQRIAARSKTMIELQHNRSRAATAAASTQRLRRVSRETIASSSSTLKASTELIGSHSSLAGSRSHLNHTPTPVDRVPGSRQPPECSAVAANAAADDGWLMVKARRRSSLHWANRFNQPTGYASLPSLALQQSSEPTAATEALPSVRHAPNRNGNNGHKKVVKSVATTAPTLPNGRPKSTAVVATVPAVTATNATNGRKAKQTPPMKDVAVHASKTNCTTTPAAGKAAPMPAKPQAGPLKVAMLSSEQRQKSDLTGLKLATLRREYMRTANRNKSTAVDAKKSPQTNQPASTSTVPTDGTASARLTPDAHRDLSVGSSCDEAEAYRDDLESDEDQRKLLEEQLSLERQIRELQNTEIDVDTETDETDCETIHEDAAGPHSVDYLTSASVNGTSCTLTSSSRFAADSVSLETRYQLLLSDMSLGERTETLATLRAFVARHPGRAQELHQKLSSPSRRRSLHETLKLYQAKHARAQAKRDALNGEKAHKLQVLLARVEDVKAAKQQLIEDKRLRMEGRLQRAAENRTQYLRDKIRKAHDEEEKMKEIAFIKNLEAQNKRLDFMESWREQEGRLLDLEQERQKRVEEKAAKEAAVEKRRLELEQERQRRLEKMNETRREREQRIGEMQERREKLRQQVARDRARDREERLQALQAQQQHSTEELQRKITHKQQESARRHEENIEHIRQRALELSIPGSRQADENGQPVTPRGSGGDGAHDNDLSSLVSDVSREYATKATKKRLKKVTQKLQQKTDEYVADMEPLPAYVRNSSEVPRLLGQIRKGGGAQGLERPLNQLMRCIDKTQVYDYQCFWLSDGLGVLAKVIQTGIEGDAAQTVSRRAQVIAVQLYRKLCLQCPQLARHAILANSFTVLCDALLCSLQTPDETAPGQPVELSTELMIACISPFPTLLKRLHPQVVERLPLVISYVVATGLVDTMARRLLKIRESVENHGSVILSLLATIGLLTKFGDLCPKGGTDLTKFLSTVKSTELLGAVSLLHSTVIPLGECIPPRTVSLAADAFRLLVTIANLDLAVFQDVLSDESLAFQLLDVATVLLTYCGPKATDKGETSALIVDLIATLGFYSANNTTNQNRLTSEQSATIVKALAKLPKDFEMIVYPTLITVITDNAAARLVVGREFDVTMLEEYKQSTLAQKQSVVSVLNAGVTTKKS